jgi:hypothetical protein
MPWNGSGAFTRVHNWVADALALINITASRFDAENDDFATGIETCLTKDGQNAPTQDLPMAGKKHLNVGNSTARNQYPTVEQYQDGKIVWGGTTAGTSAAYTLTLTPTITAYVAGMRIAFIAHADSAADATLNIDAVSADDLFMEGLKVRAGSLQQNQVYIAIYDGTQWQVFASGNSTDVSLRGCKIKWLSGTDPVLETGSNNALQFSSEVYDTDSFHDIVTANSRITIPPTLAGIYRVEATVHGYLAGGATAQTMELWMDVNGGLVPISTREERYLTGAAELAAHQSYHLSTIVSLSASDYIRLILNLGGAGNFYFVDAYEWSVTWLGPTP